MDLGRNDTSYTCSVGFVGKDDFTWLLVIHRSIVPKGKLVYFLETEKQQQQQQKPHYFFPRI